MCKPLKSRRYEALSIANPTNHHAQILKENLAMNIEEILKGTSLKNRNESLLIKSTIELLHKKIHYLFLIVCRIK